MILFGSCLFSQLYKLEIKSLEIIINKYLETIFLVRRKGFFLKCIHAAQNLNTK